MTRLCRVRERWRDTFEDTFFTKIGGFLACDAQRGPRHRFQAPLADFVAAMQTDSE